MISVKPATFEAKKGGDFFPQNQWIVTQEDKEKKTIQMYVLGRYGIYCVALKYDEKDESFMFTTASFAA